MLDQIITILQKQYAPVEVYGSEERLRFVTVDKEKALDAVKYMKENAGYQHLVLLTAVDYIEQGKFQLTYLLHNPTDKTDIGVRVMIDRENATMKSAHELWPTIATYQRELREMFGIQFPCSPGVNDDFILEGWSNTPPYRRDFDTKVFAESFYPQREGRVTHDPAIYMKEKLYPNE